MNFLKDILHREPPPEPPGPDPENLDGDLEAAELQRIAEHTEDVDLAPRDVELMMVRRQNEALALRHAEVEKQLEDVAVNFADTASTLDSLDAQLQTERKRQVTCPECGHTFSPKVEYPKTLFHPVQEARVVQNEDEHRALGRGWRERPFENESAQKVLTDERNARIQAEETRADDEARHKRELPPGLGGHTRRQLR